MTDKRVVQQPSGVEYYKQQGAEMMQQAAAVRQRMRQMKFDTIAVHGIYSVDEAIRHGQGSIIEPLYLSSAQQFENSDHLQTALAYEMPAWAYSRIANPTVLYLEETLSLLESYGFAGEASAACYASGMAAVFMATHPFLQLLNDKPANIVASAKCYGGTFMLFNERYGKEHGVEIRWVESPEEVSSWHDKIDAHTRFLYGETPSNPTLSVIDIKALADLAHAHEIPLIIDSTLATPALCRPLTLGADVVVHSLSKMVGAGGLSIGGALIARHHINSHFASDELKENFARYAKLLAGRDFGPALSPFNAFMLLNDLRTLRSRANELSNKTMQVASFLSERPEVEQVMYPGLDGHLGHVVAKQQMQLVDCPQDHPQHRYGNLLSFTLKNGPLEARRVLDRLQLVWRATDLGRIKSIATIPSISTHQQQGEEGRKLASLPENMIRLSIGNEAPEDVIADLEQALAT